MYRIIKDGATVGITGALNYIKLQDNGCYGLCSEAEAQGVAFGGVPYQLESKIEMGGLDVVTVVEENDVDISGDHIKSAHLDFTFQLVWHAAEGYALRLCLRA